MEYLRPGSTDPTIIVEDTAYSDGYLDPTSGNVTPAASISRSLSATPLSFGDVKPTGTVEDPQLSYKQISLISGVLLLFTAGFAVSCGLIQSNTPKLARSYSDVFDAGCVDTLGDSESSKMAQVFELDMTFGKFIFTQAKVIDVVWDTTIGQGGRLLHGWILYRCVMRRLLIDAMEHHHVTFRYFFTVSWSRASLDSLWAILKDIVYMKGSTTILCTTLLVYALGYTLLFPVLWSAATGYFSLSHRLYAMPDATLVPLNTSDLALCWVLDGNRLNISRDHIELGPNFSALNS